MKTTAMTIEPIELQKRLQSGNGVRVIDVREPDEFARGHMPGARCIPASGLDDVATQWRDDTETVVVCWSGARSLSAADRLKGMGFTRVAVLDGGTRAWKKAGLETVRTKRGIPVQRQVMIGAGLVHLLSFGLALIDPWFLALAVFASSMLVVAGMTGFCPMAVALARMPWNGKIDEVSGDDAGSTSCSVSEGGARCQA
jgi:rhodanese-related sulfurtransferase